MQLVLHQYIVVGGLFLQSVHASFKQLKRLPPLNGKVCGHADLLFSTISPTLSYCSGLCKDDGNCASLFYMEGNSTCYGCAVAYVEVSDLVESGGGTTYLYDPNMVPATSTTSSTSSTSSTATTSTTSTSTTTFPSTTSATTTTTPPPVIYGWHYFQGSYYRLEDEGLAYGFDQMFCKDKGANLVHISSEAENKFVGEMVKTAFGGDNFKVTIGASDVNTEATWRWINDNSLMTYHNWRGGVAHKSAYQDCAAMVLDAIGEFEWMDVDCFKPRRYICEM